MKSATRLTAECFPVWSYIHEEMIERGWDKNELAVRMGGNAREVAIHRLTLDFLSDVRDPNLHLGDESASALAYAFGVSKDLFLNLDNSYRIWLRHQQKAEDRT